MVTHYFQPLLKIAIVGLGPRGLSIFERLLSAAELLPDRYIDLAIFEPDKPGCGVHAVEQPGYLMLNTVAGQIGTYPDAAALSELPKSTPRPGPDFLNWCRSKHNGLSTSAVYPCGTCCAAPLISVV